MSDFNSSLPVRTENPGDVIVKLSDATTPSQQLAIDSSGRIIVKLQDGAGNAITSQTNGSQQALDVGINVAGVQIDPRDIRALTSADVVTVDQGTSPWITKDQSDGPVAPGTAASFASLVAGQYNATPPTVGDTQQVALQVDAAGRLLTNADVTITADYNYGVVGASTLRTASQIGNATGAADFNYGSATAQTLRVTASNLPQTADTNFGAASSSTIRAAALVGNASGLADFNAGSTGAQTLRVVANQGAANATPWNENIAQIAGSAPSASNSLPVQISTAGAFVSSSNPLPVTIDPASAGSTIASYKDASAIAGGASDNHDYTVTAAKTLYLQAVESSGSGKAKMVLQIETAAASGTFNTYAGQFNSTATPNMRFELPNPIQVATGVRVRVIMSNRDNQAQDLYSTILGYEV